MMKERCNISNNIEKRVQHYTVLVIIVLLVGVAADGIFDINTVKNTLLQWKNKKINVCPSNNNRLLNLLNLVCSTAQPTNVTARDSCYTCFSRATSATLPEGAQTLAALSVCATQYFVNTSYATCAASLVSMATSSALVAGRAKFALPGLGAAACYTGYCDFVRCLRRVNANNLIIQCTREARTGVNITVDADNVRFYKNVTSCLLARARCGNFNPVTGEPQLLGYTSIAPASANALQITTSGDLRLLSFPANIQVASVFCATSNTLLQSTWLTTAC